MRLPVLLAVLVASLCLLTSVAAQDGEEGTDIPTEGGTTEGGTTEGGTDNLTEGGTTEGGTTEGGTDNPTEGGTTEGGTTEGGTDNPTEGETTEGGTTEGGTTEGGTDNPTEGGTTEGGTTEGGTDNPTEGGTTEGGTTEGGTTEGGTTEGGTTEGGTTEGGTTEGGTDNPTEGGTTEGGTDNPTEGGTTEGGTTEGGTTEGGTDNPTEGGTTEGGTTEGGTNNPTEGGTNNPTEGGTDNPTEGGTDNPTEGGTDNPTEGGTDNPTEGGTDNPTEGGTDNPTEGGTDNPTEGGTDNPTEGGTDNPTEGGTDNPTEGGTDNPTEGGGSGGGSGEGTTGSPTPAEVIIWISVLPGFSVTEGIDSNITLCANLDDSNGASLSTNDRVVIDIEFIDFFSGAESGVDYIRPPFQQSLILTMENTSCVSISIVDDDLPESFESFEVQFSFNSRASQLSNGVIVTGFPFFYFISIADDDSVSVIASTPEDYVAEGTELEICAHLHFTNRLTSNDTVVVDIDFDDFANIFWSTAVSDVDYLPPSQRSLTLTLDNTTSCVPLSIVDDDFFEDFEYFLVLYSFNSNSSQLGDNVGVVGLPTTHFIFIANDDNATVGFEQATYHVDEGETISLCLLYENVASLEDFFPVRIFDIGGDASNDSDYEVSSSSTETPISGDTVGVKNCSNFTALEDMTVEQSIETVTFTISITFDYLVNERVIVGQQTATIFIRDIDSLASGSGLTSQNISCLQVPLNFTTEIFTPLSSLAESLSCRHPLDLPLTYILNFPTHQILLTEHELPTTIVAHVFQLGKSNIVDISVCVNQGGLGTMCDERYSTTNLGLVTVIVLPSTERLFPYGEVTSDMSFRGVLDGAVPVYPSDSIPFYSTYYRKLFVSTNGLVSFGKQYLSWWPVPFPYGGSRIPVVAPFWADFDFRNENPNSYVYYQVYDRKARPSLLEVAVLDELSARVGSDFEAQWMLVVTWRDAIPWPYWYWRYFDYQYGGQATFQMVLATNFIQTHALFLYDSSTLNLLSWQRTVVGYDAKDFFNYHTVPLSSDELLLLHALPGNTGQTGQWFFNLTTSPEDMTPEQRCLAWSARQDKEDFLTRIASLRVNACPCTRRQAWRDWSFWFGYYWGLSSRPNCATVLFSRSQSTIECCYDSSGALIVGPSEGGSYQLYNPLFFFQENFIEDLQPYQDCCVNSKRCALYYEHRPSDDCSAYVPPNPQFTWGDPHFKTVDSQNFTFNGIGEYVLVHTPSSLGFQMQARLERFSNNVTGTVMSAIALKQGVAQSVQIHAENNQLNLYIAGDLYELAVTNSPLIVNETGVASDDLTGGMTGMADPMAMAMMTDQLIVRKDDDTTLVVSTPEGASISVALQSGNLGIVVSLPDSFRNMTSGLMGVFNGDPNDDIRNRSGEILNLDTQREVYYEFGLDWHVSENESIFDYTVGPDIFRSYSLANKGYRTYEPLFLEELNVTQDVLDSCGGNAQCEYDATVTGDMSVGLATLGVANSNEEIVQTLNNMPPIITSPDNFTLFADAGETVTITFEVSDPDMGDTVATFTCMGPVEEFDCTQSGNTLQVTWTNPMAPFPNTSLQIFANDSSGAPAIRTVSVVLCQCGDGNCSMDGTLEFDSNQYYQWPCECPDFFSGDSCEVDERGCDQASDPCPPTSVCVSNASVPIGYVCAECQEGYSLTGTAMKCMDDDECNSTVPHNCSQVCINTDGSYMCGCEPGYTLGPDMFTCEDVDECLLGTSNCSQRCNNTEGSYDCYCEPGYDLMDDNITCEIASCPNNPCDPELECVVVDNFFECLCPVGQECNSGTCNSTTLSDLALGQNCEDCPDNRYGLRCAQMCDCVNGTCNATTGCVCADGYSGLRCDQEINDHSPLINASAMHRVRWDLEGGAEIITITATDLDVGPNAGTVEFEIVPSPYPLPSDVSDGMGIFSIHPTTGLVTLNNSLIDQVDRFVQFNVFIRASDGGDPQRFDDHAIMLHPIPVPVLELQDAGIEIDEEPQQGTVITSLTCNEIGLASNSIDISLSGEGARFFGIEGTSDVTVFGRLDYETLTESERELTIMATCRNMFGLSDSLTFTISIRNTDDNLFIFESSPYVTSVYENATRGEVVTTVSASDRDMPNVAVLYSLEQSADSAPFTLQSDGVLTVINSLDRETQSVYVLTIGAAYMTGNGSQERTSGEVEIRILDINDEHPIFEPSPVYVTRNITTSSEIGDFVLTVSANDADAGTNGEVTYQLQEDSNGGFEINETTGEIYVASVLTHGLHTLIVNATDGGTEPLSAEAFVYVYVQSSPDRILLTLAQDPFTVGEDVQIGSQVAQVFSAVIDNNVTLNESTDLTVTFEIVNGSDTSRFTISRSTGEIFTLSTLDYEVAMEYDLVVEGSLILDDTELTNQTVVRITVQNLNDNPPRFVPVFYAETTEQFTLPDLTILTVSAMDPDMLADIQYSLTGDDSALFQINSTSGEISALEELITPQDYRFSVVASDGGLETSSAVVFIAVTRSVTVAPAFTRDEFVFTLSENANPGTHVGRVMAITRGNRSSTELDHLGFRITEPDIIDFNVTAPLTTNVSQNLFHIETETGIIRTQAMFEFDIESRQDYLFYVEVYNRDDDMTYANATVIIKLLDENDNPPLFDRSLYTRVITTDLTLGSEVIVVTATDRDSGNNSRVTYDFDQQNRTLGFALNSSSGVISVSNSTLIPGDYYLNLVASDGGFPVLTASATVYVAVIPVSPTSIGFTNQTYQFDLIEDAPPNTLIGIVEALETNTSRIPPNLVYTLPNITTCFSVDSRSGEIRVSCTSLDRESSQTHELLIMAEADNITAYGTVIVTLLDVNDNPPVFSLDIYTRVIDDRFGNSTAILRVMARDTDAGANGTVTYDLVPASNTVFRIDSTTGEVFLVEDSIALGDYRLLVEATDMGTLTRMSSSALVLICVTRAHPQTLEFNDITFEVFENVSANTLVGVVTLTTNTGSVVNPLDFPDNLQFTIVGGGSPELFLLDAESGELRTRTQTLDREMAASHVIEIMANFTAFPNIPTPSIRDFFTINILDINDNSPTLMSLYDTVIDDSAMTNQVLLNITSQDIDSAPNAQVSFSIDAQPPGVFGVRVTETSLPYTYGEIFVNDTDSLLPGTYQFTLTATDSGNPALQTTADVDVIVEHAIPEMISFSPANYSFGLVEEVEEGAVVGNVSILPETPALDDLVFVITGGSGREHFSLDVASGMLRTRHREIDRERITTFDLSIRAFLPGQDPPLEAETLVVIDLIDINDNRPMFTEGVYNTVGIDTDELDTSVSLINDIFASDIDIGPNAAVVYSIHTLHLNQTLQNDPSAFFILNSTTARLYPASLSIPTGTYILNISGSDQGTPVQSGYTSLAVVIQRPAPTSIAFTNPSGYTFMLNENTGPTVFARVMLDSIPDYLHEFVTYVARDQNLNFIVGLHSGEISSVRSFDYEIDKVFSFDVQARFVASHRVPPINLTTEVTVTVEIVDVNDNSPYFIDFPSAITQYEERPTIEVVHTIFANDSDSGSNAELMYEIVGSELQNILTIDPTNGRIMAAANLDREDPALEVTHTVMVRVTDRGSPSRFVTDTTTFTLLDINDNQPRLSSGFAYSANERLPAGTEVFSFVGVDRDVGANSTVRYFLTSTNAPFTCDEITGTVTLTEELDYESITSYPISLRLEDIGSPVQTTNYNNITASVVNLPDNTPQFNQTEYRGTTDPTVLMGDILFQVQATDADLPNSNDSLRYAITGVRATGNVLPQLRIEPTMGRILGSDTTQIINPEAVLAIEILVYDQSRFNLSNTTTVVITVVPDPLVFTHSQYTVNISENANIGSLVYTLPIHSLSVSSDITYSFEVDPPILGEPTFTSSGNGAPAVAISLAEQPDREVRDRYDLTVTATRPGEEAQATLIVIIIDYNDNRPLFRDMNYTMVTIPEDAATPTNVTRSNATDADINENARLVYNLFQPSSDLPFEIDAQSGVIQTRGVLDYETVSSYNITVLVHDSGQPRLQNQIVYTIMVQNINDNFPVFAAPAYFGEVYALASAGATVLHTEVRVTDEDDLNSEQRLTFEITRADSVQQEDDYRFSVSSQPPYRIIVDSLPEEADVASQLLELRLEVADEGGRLARVPLYISIFTSDNLGDFVLGQVDRELLLSCEDRASSMCALRDTVAALMRQRLEVGRLTFFNNSVQQFGNGFLVELFGWQGRLDSRENRGELESADRLPAIQYVDYDETLFREVADAPELDFLAFAVNLQEKPTPPATSQATEVPAALPIELLAGVGVGAVVAILMVVLIVVIVCVFGRRRNQPRKKNNRRPSDLYERSINRFPRHGGGKKSKGGSSDDIPLHSQGQSDLAYETMYDDDDIVDTAQTMPWFDPKYLASGKDDYDGDTERSLPRPPGERGEVPFNNLRATVDGDARRGRRHSSDESAVGGASVTEMDQSEYLKGYQSSTPMQPGQRMGEFDMFASPRDPDRPFRPSLEHAQNHWQRNQQPQQQHQQQQRPPGQQQLRPGPQNPRAINNQQQQLQSSRTSNQFQQLQPPGPPRSSRQNSRATALKGPLARK